MTSDVLSRLARILTSEFDVPSDQISPEARLNEDFRLDSVGAVEFVFEIEDEFGIEVSDDEVLGVRTLADLIRAVEIKLAEA